MTVKRSPYRVGQKLSVDTFTSQAPRFSVPVGTGGFIVKEINKTNHRSGGYIFTAESVRNINGERLQATWMVTFPSFGRATVKTPYFTSLRVWRKSQNFALGVEEDKPFKPTKVATSAESERMVAKSVVAGSRPKRMVLADFLEE